MPSLQISSATASSVPCPQGKKPQNAFPPEGNRWSVERLTTQSSRDTGLWRTGERQELHCTQDMICPDSLGHSGIQADHCLHLSTGMRVVSSQTSEVNPEMPCGEHQGLLSWAVFPRAHSIPTSWFTVPLFTAKSPSLLPPLTLVHLFHLQ